MLNWRQSGEMGSLRRLPFARPAMPPAPADSAPNPATIPEVPPPAVGAATSTAATGKAASDEVAPVPSAPGRRQPWSTTGREGSASLGFGVVAAGSWSAPCSVDFDFSAVQVGDGFAEDSVLDCVEDAGTASATAAGASGSRTCEGGTPKRFPMAKAQDVKSRYIYFPRGRSGSRISRNIQNGYNLTSCGSMRFPLC